MNEIFGEECFSCCPIPRSRATGCRSEQGRRSGGHQRTLPLVGASGRLMWRHRVTAATSAKPSPSTKRLKNQIERPSTRLVVRLDNSASTRNTRPRFRHAGGGRRTFVARVPL